MSSPAPPPPPLAPGTVVAGLTIEASGVIWWQWVTFFIVANVFAGFWLVLALLNAHPDLAFKVAQLLRKLGLGGGKKKAHHSHSSSKEHEMQEQQQDGGDAAKAAAALAPAGAVPPLTLPAAGAGKGITPRHSTELGSPLRSHRSRPQPPPMLVVEQAISPRPSTTPKLSGLISPQVSQPYSPTGYVTPRERGSFETEAAAAAAAAAGGGAAAVGGDSDDSFTDESSLEGEPLLVKLEWRNMCYAVKAASGLRLIVQGIYGCANPQELQGLMGPSGAGKSTLMDLLSKRTDPAGSSQAAPQLTQEEGQHAQQQQHQTRSSDGAASSVADGGTSSAASADAAVVHVAEEAAAAAARKAAGGSSFAVADQPSELLVNGAPLGRKAFMKISAYVPQHDNLVPTMTAHEAVSFYASIILPPQTSQHTKRARIARVLAMMGLTHAAHTLVGGALPGGILLRGLSGGEKKRLAIACGVVAGPSLVFLDEPTSGLDSFAALNVVLFLKSMATQGGSTLIASLHQPRSAIWGQLDQVTLLASGRLMYTGPTDALVSWFQSLGYAYSPSTHGMASDWALDLVSLGFTKPQSQTQQGAEAEQQQQGSAAGGSGLRQRLGGAHSGSSSAQQQQQPASSSSVSMMSSKQELNDAAAAFLQHLAGLHPHWFQAAAAGGAPHKAAATANGSLTNGLPALSAIRVTPAADQATAGVLGSDTAASPFLQQDSGDEVQQQQAAAQAKQLAALEQDQPGDRGLVHTTRGAWRKYKALLWRELLIATRNPADVGGRMMTFTYVSLLSGLISWNLPGGADSIMNRVSVAYAVLSFYLLMPFVFMSLFTSDKRFFAVDTTARLYHPAQYYAAKVTVTLPFNMLVAVVFHLIYYGMTGMRHGSLFMAQSCVVSLIMGVTAMQAVYCCAIVASSQDLAFVYAIAWTALNLLVNPYMALFNLYSLGWGFSWLRYLSPFNFAWQALVKIELAGRGFDCNSGSGLRVLGLIPDLLPQGPSFALVRSSLANLASISTNRQCIASGDAVVDMYTAGLSVGATVAILLGYFLLFMSVTYYVVWKSSKQRGPTL